jgi:hypothetical protein
LSSLMSAVFVEEHKGLPLQAASLARARLGLGHPSPLSWRILGGTRPCFSVFRSLPAGCPDAACAAVLGCVQAGVCVREAGELCEACARERGRDRAGGAIQWRSGSVCGAGAQPGRQRTAGERQPHLQPPKGMHTSGTEERRLRPVEISKIPR